MGVSKYIQKGGHEASCIVCGENLPERPENEDRHILLVDCETYPLCESCFEETKSTKKLFFDLHERAKEIREYAEEIKTVATDVLQEIIVEDAERCDSMGYID